MTTPDRRPSGVPGLAILGKASEGYRIWSWPEGEARPTELSRDFNDFDTVRDAKAAARRLADLLPWNDTAAMDAAIRLRSHLEWRIAFAEALTGKTRAQLEAEHAAKSATRRGAGQ